MTINERLRELNLSQSKASRLADVPQPCFNRICNNKTVACPSWRKRIAHVLGVAELDIFTEEGRIKV